MPGGMTRPKTSAFLLLTFTLLVLFPFPRPTQSGTVTIMYMPQATAAMTTASNNTTTSSTTNQTTSTGNVSSSWHWDLFVPLIVIAVGATLAVIVAAVVVVKRRHPRVMPTVQLVCPRCRAPVSPYDSACRNCRTPFYHPYRYYQQRH